MLDDLKEEKIVQKCGGRFKLSTLIQKRLVALNRGARPLIELQTRNPMEIVVQEIIQDKIFLDASGNVAIAKSGDPDKRPLDAGPTFDLVLSRRPRRRRNRLHQLDRRFRDQPVHDRRLADPRRARQHDKLQIAKFRSNHIPQTTRRVGTAHHPSPDNTFTNRSSKPRVS